MPRWLEQLATAALPNALAPLLAKMYRQLCLEAEVRAYHERMARPVITQRVDNKMK